MVLMQCAAMKGVLSATNNPQCTSNDQCNTGQVCANRIPGNPYQHQQPGICQYCGQTPVMTEQHDNFNVVPGTFNNPMSKTFVGFNLTATVEFCNLADATIGINQNDWCNGIYGDPSPDREYEFPPQQQEYLNELSARARTASLYDCDTALAWPKTWCDACLELNRDGSAEVSTAKEVDRMSEIVGAMGGYDVVTFVVVAAVVALAVVQELKDVILVNLAAQHVGAALGAASRNALLLLSAVRRWILLPCVVSTMPLLVKVKGGDALNICMNAVAILFIVEVDNVFFAIFLPERVYARVEAMGHVELSEEELSMLARGKIAHSVLMVVAMCLTLFETSLISRSAQGVVIYTALWASTLVEHSAIPGQLTKARSVAWSTLGCMVGVVVYELVFGL